jgi:hypothetical protein
MSFDAVDGRLSSFGWRGKDSGVTDDHIESTWWSRIDPFCSKLSNRMKRIQVACLSVDELVLGPVSKIFNVLDCPNIRV